MSLPPCAQDSVPGEVAGLLPGRELHPLEAPGFAWRTETGADVALQNPLWRVLPGEHVEALLDGIRGRTLGAEAVGVWIAQSLRDGVQGEQVEGLHGPVMHRGDRQGALAVRAVLLRNVDTP